MNAEITLQCKCGWIGTNRQLCMGNSGFSTQCPECHESFSAWPAHPVNIGDLLLTVGDFPLSEKTVALVPSRPDSDVAKDLKAELETKLNELCLLIDTANHAGFEVALGLAKRWDGKNVIQQLTVAKHF